MQDVQAGRVFDSFLQTRQLDSPAMKSFAGKVIIPRAAIAARESGTSLCFEW